MYFIFNILLFTLYVNAFIKFNKVSRTSLCGSPLYEQPNWNFIGKSLKLKARNWFVKRAEQRGIKWNETSNFYKNNLNKLLYWKVKNTNMSIEYPSYYIKPFHGYDEGNMNWQAAYEGEAATLSMSANYWKDILPETAEVWLRKNITTNVDEYISRYTIDSSFSYEKLGSIFSSNKHEEKKIFLDKIIDIGCSFGISTEYLKEHYKESMITGIDLSPYFLAVAAFRNNRTSNNIQYVHANAEMMPFENDTYDKAFIQYLFHEMPQTSIQNVINEAYRLLKPGGILAIVDLEPKNLNEQLKKLQQ